MKIKFLKLHENAVAPKRAHKSDAGADLTATSRSFDEHGCAVYGTGIAVEIPEGWVGLVFPRSSVYKTDLALSNAVGVIDSGYRGEIMMKFRINKPKPSLFHKWLCWIGLCDNPAPKIYHIGDRIGQLVIMHHTKADFILSESLSESERGAGGYGSTGK